MLYRGIWRCKGVYGDVWGGYGDVLVCMVMYRITWCCIWVYGVVLGYMAMYRAVW